MSSTPDTTVVGLPDSGPTTVGAVRQHLGMAPEDERDAERLGRIVAAVNAMVRRWPCSTPALSDVTLPAEQRTWDAAANVVEGATMLAARIYRRKDSPAGVATFGSDGAVYVQRNDPDIAQLLELGSWSGPQVG